MKIKFDPDNITWQKNLFILFSIITILLIGFTAFFANADTTINTKVSSVNCIM